MCALVNVQRHIHLEARQLRTLYDGQCTVAEVGKLHQFVQLVISGQRAVTQHVTHIRRTQHIDSSAHIHIVQCTADAGKEVDESLTIGYALSVLLGINNLVVLGTETKVRHNMVKIGKIDTTVHIQLIVLR